LKTNLLATAVAPKTQTVSPSPGPTPIAEPITARDYHRAHAGKLMVMHRPDASAAAAHHFFHVESVGTHPTGLIVTGTFENARRSHMMATAVREANPAEIEWLRARQN
jgi:hypothetical protein